jgi:hypothetical protein
MYLRSKVIWQMYLKVKGYPPDVLKGQKVIWQMFLNDVLWYNEFIYIYTHTHVYVEAT